KDGLVHLWDVDTGRELGPFAGHAGTVATVAFSSDGRFAFSGGDDHTVRVWTIPGGFEQFRFDGHTRPVLGVACARDTRHLLSSSQDTTLRLCALPPALGTTPPGELRRLPSLNSPVERVTVSPDGKVVAAAAQDKAVHRWPLPDGKQQAMKNLPEA